MSSNATAPTVVEVLSIIAVILRFITRKVTKVGIAADDWCCLASVLSSIVVGGLSMYGEEIYPGGVIDRADPDFDYTAYVSYLKISYATGVLFFTIAMTVKISMLLMYRRIFGDRLWAYWRMVVVIMAWWVAGTISAGVSCIPASRLWEGDAAGGFCFNYNVFWMSMGVIEVLIDAFILVLPIKAVMTLHMPKEQKLLVSSIFLLGGFIIATGIARVILGYQPGSQNANFVESQLWTAVHTSMSILCACLPTFRPLLYRFTAVVRRFYTSNISTNKGNNPSKLSSNDNGIWSKNQKASELHNFSKNRQPVQSRVEDGNVETICLTKPANGDTEIESEAESFHMGNKTKVTSQESV